MSDDKPLVNEEQHQQQMKQLSLMNGEINRMTRKQVVRELSKLNMDTRGNLDVLKKRLKNFHKKQKLGRRTAPSGGGFNSSWSSGNTFDYYCVIDFEATCERPNPPNFKHEIIEFPAVLICAHNLEILAEFHRYCRPTVNPLLTDFCTKLTGITQKQVDEAAPFPVVLKEFNDWLAKLYLGSRFEYAIVTDGPCDMGRFLTQQCDISGIPFPKFGKKWINIRKSFSNFYHCKRMSLAQMLETLGLDFEGQQHCGLDDAKNIARIATHLLADGANLRINERVFLNKPQNVQKVTSNSIQKSQTDEILCRKKNHQKQKNSSLEEYLYVEEQLRNLGVDPSLENSLEKIMAETLLL